MIVWNVKYRLTWSSDPCYGSGKVLARLKNIAPNKRRMNNKRTAKKKYRDSLILSASVRGRELKRFSQNLITNWNAIGTSGTTQELTQLITQGLGLGQRIGRQIHLSRIQLVGVLHGAQSNLVTDDAYNEVRIMIIEGEPNTSWAANILLNTVVEPKTVQYLHRVIMDKRVMLKVPAKDSTGYLPALVPINISQKLDFTVNYMSEAGNFTTYRSLYLYMCSDSALVPNPGFVTGYMNLEFTTV